jgi:hypothetical protein
MSVKNSSDTMGNRNRNVPACSAVPQPLRHRVPGYIYKANWIGYILRRNCLLKHVIEGKLEGRIEMTRRRGRRRKQLLDDLQEKRRYWKLKEEALDRTL